MGKLLLDSATTWQDPVAKSLDTFNPLDLSPAAVSTTVADDEDDDGWGNVHGLEKQQVQGLKRLYTKGVLWKHPKQPGEGSKSSMVMFRLKHGGEVSSDGNCLFSSMEKAMGSVINGKELRRRAVKRFLVDYGSGSSSERKMIDDSIRHMYSPDLECGWGIHVVQEIKLLAEKVDREELDSAIDELVQIGMHRDYAAESIYKERCVAVKDAESWGMYMLISGSIDDKHDIITLQYTEDGLLLIDENKQGHAAAFGDDMAIESLATEFKREIYVVQAHGSDGMVDEDNCVFFLPHRPRSEICQPPIFLFMKGTGWCGAGGDHYEPLIAHASAVSTIEKAELIL